MTVWIEGDFESSSWFPLRDQFDELSVSLGAPKNVLLVQIDDGSSERTRLIASLPSQTYLPLFTGFREIPVTSLPRHAARLVVGQLSEATKFFEFPEHRANA